MTQKNDPQKSDPKVWLNGSLIPEAEARVSLFDRGYLYGDGLFETVRAYNGRVFRLGPPLERLHKGAAAIGLSLPYSDSDISEAVETLLAANDLADAYLRLSISRGIGLGPLPPAETPPTVSIIARPLSLPPAQEYERGWSAILAESLLAPTQRWAHIKPLSYLDKLVAKREAQKAGAKEAILVNCRGEVTEASTSNIFLIRNRRLLTPPPASGLLLGITRQAVLEIASEIPLPTEERPLMPDDIHAADEAFLTNSIIEIMPLTQLDGGSVGSGPGELTRALQQALTRLIKRELTWSR